EYNTTTTHSDYGNRLYCLLDFLRLEALYDRFEWNTIPWQVAHETMVRSGDLELAAAVEKFVDDESKGIASSFVEELEQLETEYGVRLPALHDHVGECIIGALAQNRMAALVSRACPGIPGQTQADVEVNFAALRTEIADFMSKRIGSGIEPPEWMQRLAGELERVQEGRPGALTDSLMDGEFRKITQRAIDQQLAGIIRRNDAAESGM
ncbi:MAG: hypothetical protein KDB01_04310, partial [Planctomycetaceae bacterium]|nr:hypothetical protein [Planctomycetaceae bacterium]